MDISAPKAYRLLNGIFTIYKPPKIGMTSVRKLIMRRLTNELNSMEVRPVAKRICIEGELSKGENLTVKMVQNYADHPLVVGPRYQEKDFGVKFVSGLDYHTSGVIPLGIGAHGCYLASKMEKSLPIRCYQIKGRLGFATDDFTISGNIREKSKYSHVGKARLDNLLAVVEGSHRNSMIQSMPFDINSQEGYKMLSEGLVKPFHKDKPIIYSVRCIHFQPPDFVIEVQCLNEFMVYLRRLIHDIGLRLKTNATTVSIRRTRLGSYKAENALLIKQCSVANVIQAIQDKGERAPEIGPDLFEDEDELEIEELEDFETDYIPLPQDYGDKPKVTNPV
ncbi:pseudouridylate synthase TRUB2, mitochondrial [Brevipalpus obovatus]|uniref:pseudouridylate synthase TRUB2, mitochondrial n=1 Tax=Brevipalpus obovatus TaxID=246614 RepID=UPI003D9DC3CF